MTPNSILSVQLKNRSLDPAQAEVQVHVTPARRTPTTELRGRLVGPHCLYATTVEVSYPLRPLPRPPGDSDELLMRVVIPEPSLWDPESPFLYRAHIELWEDGQRHAEIVLDHGLRTLQLSRNGVRINHRIWSIRGGFFQGEEPGHGATGINLLVAPPRSEALWALTDERGLLMLGQLESPFDLLQASLLSRHAAALGFLLSDAEIDDPELARMPLPSKNHDPYLGVTLTRPVASLPDFISFFVAPEQLLPQLTALQLPYLVLTTGHAGNGAPPPTPPAGAMGWLQKPSK